MKKDIKALIALLISLGCTVIEGKNHYKAISAQGKVTFSKTPSDVRALLNIRRDIKHNLGFDIRNYVSNI